MSKEVKHAPDPESEPLLVSAQAAAKMLSIGQAHLWGLNAAGRIPQPVKLGRRTLWKTDELRQWAKAGCPSRERWQAMGGAS